MHKFEKLKQLFLALFTLCFALSLIIFPKEAFQASLKGLQMWWTIVFPSLLPFFIISELLIYFGVVRFIGMLLEPFMRPCFRVPGAGGFVFAMGLASGFPAGAKLTTRLREEGQLSRIEAERLVSFTNSSNPLFIFGAVAVGFFHNTELGLLLAISHYLGNVCVGLVMRFYGKDHTPLKKQPVSLPHSSTSSIIPLGRLLGDAVHSSIRTLLLIGGFIMIFSVLNQMLSLVHITSLFAMILSHLFSVLNIDPLLSFPFFSGLFEITLGSQLTSEFQAISLLDKAIIVSFILAFNGFSVHAQVASILAESDIRFKPFFIARLLHGLFSSILTFLLFKPLYLNRLQKKETWAAMPHPHPSFLDVFHFIVNTYGSLITLICLLLFLQRQVTKLK